MKRLRAGIIGLGIGEAHVKGYLQHPHCEVTAVCDFSDEKIAMAREKYRGLKITRHAGEILEDPNIDVVSIASYDNYHYEQIVKGIEKDKHIFVEKPICLKPGEAASIRGLLKERPHIRLSSNLALRSCPMFFRLKERVQSGEMGSLFYIEADYLWGRMHKIMDGWRKELEFYSIVYGAAVHMIDLVLWVTGRKPLEVHGYGNRIATGSSGFRFNDFAALFMKFEDGMTAKVSASGGCVHPHFHRVGLFGTRATFFNDISGGKLLKSSDPGGEVIELDDEYPAIEKRGEILTSFIDWILGLTPEPLVPCEDVFDTMSVCFSAEKAIEEGHPVRIDYL